MAFSGMGGAVVVGRCRSVVVAKGEDVGDCIRLCERAPACGEGGSAGGVGSVVAVEGVDFATCVWCEPLWRWKGFGGRCGVEGRQMPKRWALELVRGQHWRRSSCGGWCWGRQSCRMCRRRGFCAGSNGMVGKVIVAFGPGTFVDAVDVGGCCLGLSRVGEDVAVGCGASRRHRGKRWRLCKRCRRGVYWEGVCPTWLSRRVVSQVVRAASALGGVGSVVAAKRSIDAGHSGVGKDVVVGDG